MTPSISMWGRKIGIWKTNQTFEQGRGVDVYLDMAWVAALEGGGWWEGLDLVEDLAKNKKKPTVLSLYS